MAGVASKTAWRILRHRLIAYVAKSESHPFCA